MQSEAKAEITLSFEPPDEPAPKPRAPPLTSALPPPPPVEEVEYDDFGLPVRKPRQIPAYDYDISDSEDELPPPVPEKPKVVESPVEKKELPAPPPKESTLPIAQSYASVVATATASASAPATLPPPKEEVKEEEPSKSNNRASIASISETDRKNNEVKMFSENPKDPHMPIAGSGTVSEWSHQSIVPRATAPKEDTKDQKLDEEDEWQSMPAYASYDMYDDDGRLIARAHDESGDEEDAGAAKGYTRVYEDEDVESVTSMDENTKYLFKENDDDEAARNPLSQMQATKELLTEGQRIAYVGVCRLALLEMVRDLQKLQVKNRTAKKNMQMAVEGMRMWSQKIMVRLYTHMELSPPEQLAEHGVLPSDLTPTLLKNSRVLNPMARRESVISSRKSVYSNFSTATTVVGDALPEYEDTDLAGDTKTLSELPNTKTIDIDLRWTILCDLFLVLIADSVYDARARVLLERVGKMFDISWLDICKFEKRVTDALDMQESAEQSWSEKEHLEARAKNAKTKRMIMLGLATVGGGLVIGLSGGLLAPVIGAGLAAGFTTIGVAGTSGFLAGAGGTAIIASTAAASGSYVGGKAGFNRTKSVQTFEFKPLHNAKRVNLIITVAGWMNGKVDDVRLPFSTVDPIMGDLFSIHWEPEMLQSMGRTIQILATEAILGQTILVSLMAAIQLPVVLTKLSYLLDNPWSVSLDRAAAAGLILADTLVHRNLGVRPVTLVGYSLGARVIFYCLKELARVGASGLVQNAYMFGSPVVVKHDEYAQVVAMVSGRFVNAYSTSDWILGYLFRATSGGISRVAGLATVDLPGVENVDVTDLVNGHMAYRAAMPKLLMRVGWEVTSDEFSEIEDPDPDNHQNRQRELINELDEARREMEQGSRKPRWSFFGRKEVQKKKDWEMYAAGGAKGDSSTTLESSSTGKDGVLFDVDAIEREIEASSKNPKDQKLSVDTGLKIPTEQLRHTKSFDDSKHSPTKANFGAFGMAGKTIKEDDYDYDEFQDGEELQLQFEPEPRRNSYSMEKNVWADYDEYDDYEGGGAGGKARDGGEMTMTFA
ncbi:Similar to Uncharacterized membrane protein C6F6.13c; acc. no. O14244 [Pyronema omphalodes CBS 100304]|uniref:Similar to Uncharacterized membrane protein C6F6.13c acc. no. O14244 n=1 Tax=Pyronema omphalodes (strain CBS 100304) TaxID=1076935 RepID=U4L4R9_PYROM|nr:Similar to Uncharacterized membrane protein C6F6.13c; acc. no. O14244 [Pyronema omphalodes CBS 100304]